MPLGPYGIPHVNNGTNNPSYDEWKTRIHVKMACRNLWRIVDGSDVCPTDPAKTNKIDDWHLRALKAKDFLMDRLSAYLLPFSTDNSTVPAAGSALWSTYQASPAVAKRTYWMDLFAF